MWHEFPFEKENSIETFSFFFFLVFMGKRYILLVALLQSNIHPSIHTEKVKAQEGSNDLSLFSRHRTESTPPFSHSRRMVNRWMRFFSSASSLSLIESTRGGLLVVMVNRPELCVCVCSSSIIVVADVSLATLDSTVSTFSMAPIERVDSFITYGHCSVRFCAVVE